MQVYKKTEREMERETIQKKRANLKNRSRGKLYFLYLLLMPLVFGSCATVFSGTKQKITVTGNISTPVELLVDGKRYENVTLPAKVKIKRKNPASRIAAFAPNYNVKKQELEKTFNHLVWLNAWPWLPVLPIPLFIDWQTGANKRAVQKEVAFDFTPANSTQEFYNAYIDFGTEHYNAGLLDEALYYFNQAYEIDTVSDIALQKINATYARMDYLEEQARLKAERGEMWSNILMLVGVGLQTTADIVSTVQSTNGTGNSVSGSSGNSGGGCNCANIQTLYTRAKQKAYGDAGTYGYSRAKEVIGTDNSAGNAAVKSSAGSAIRTYQNEMSRLERDAAKCGCPLR